VGAVPRAVSYPARRAYDKEQRRMEDDGQRDRRPIAIGARHA
jgi:hypothetical protein